MKPGAVASRSGSAVAFSWEQEPGVSRLQSPVEASSSSKQAEGGGRRAPAPASSRRTHGERARRLRVPPPPGGPGAPAVPPPARRRSRGVRPEEDPFLAAYRACITEDGSHSGKESNRAQKLLEWSGLGLGLGLGLRGFGLSCKGSCGPVEASLVRLAKIPQVHED